MAFAVPTPVASKGIRGNIARTKVHSKFQPSTDLFCSKCLAKSLIKEAYGFCKVCLDFLCDKCVDKHESTLINLNHGIIVGAEMLARYQHAMRDNKKTGKSVSRNYLDMVADGRASFQYFDEKLKEKKDPDDDVFQAELINELKVKVASDVAKCFICACVIYSDGKVILADANNKSLKLFSKHFNCLHTFHLKKEPWDICRANDFENDLYVTESQINGVHQFKVTKEVIYLLTVKVDGECFGLTDWKGGVAVSVKKDKKFSVKLLDQFGNTYRHIRNGYDDQLKLLCPWYLASIKKGQFVLISDSGTGTVSCVDVDGGVEFIYKNRKELKDPRNISTDRDGNIFVVDYEADTIHQMTDRGQDLGVVLRSKDGLDNPCGMACHKELLYIQTRMDSNFMKIYDLL